MKQYGPYESTPGHLFVVRVFDDGTRKSIWLHREVMEEHLGRRLQDDEVVHHINEDKLDNRIENLAVMTRGEHSSEHALPPEVTEIVCEECSETAFVLARRIRHNQWKKGGAGPFCGRRCAGRFNARLRK